MAARLADDLPGYEPVLEMALAAHALSERTKPYRDADSVKLADVIAANDKVAQYTTPKLKAIEHTGAEGGPIRAILSQDDSAL